MYLSSFTLPVREEEWLIQRKMTHYCGCQFIIATHSPFLLALEGARIYDLDVVPTEVRNWWELENAKIYYEFFKRYQKLFEK